jgi:hypothetical protein
MGRIASLAALNLQHAASPLVSRQWEDEPPAEFQAVEPHITRVRDTGIDKDRVKRGGDAFTAVTMQRFNIAEVCKVLTGAQRKLGINLDADDVSGRAYYFSHDRRVVAESAADVKDVISGVKVERIEPERDPARQPVVQVAARVNRNKHVLI